VIFEAKNLVSAGHKEIVVTGVNLGSYGRESVRNAECRTENAEHRTKNIGQKTEDGRQIVDCRLSIVDLLEELAKIEGLLRLRVSSLEPGDISEELLDVFCAHKNIMPHIHLSVQSGSEKILRRMCRPYSAGELREKIAMIKSRLDRPAITCDIIVGFPGETEEDFEETVELSKWAGFSKIHVFPFSARAGTAAAKMKEKIQPKVVKIRAEILRRLGDELALKFREQFVGETVEVLLEDTEPMSGHCERYFLVQVTKDCRLPIVDCRFNKNQIVKVRITDNQNEGAEGQM
jgi:threonylcarbamoyladenosine tRNA methylthiotransferase MtaB